MNFQRSETVDFDHSFPVFLSLFIRNRVLEILIPYFWKCFSPGTSFSEFPYIKIHIDGTGIEIIYDKPVFLLVKYY